LQTLCLFYNYTGVIIPTDDVDGRTIYSVPSAGIEYAYKAEIIQYLETGTFTYDETLEDPVDSSVSKD
jgi:hypothetical protein